ncbi:hypothetical protein [Pseudoduganella buxea]|uniref:Hemerythrin n=1 Tax=Pseudoduganella buxea TaxID=1949069 RepID=A0A6I3T2L8_9BURK|nr:hypothetical protein [Pseudoduganella buxea]MTV55741.1 hypothetical protein [Pseudoduganella buxea]GGC13383.1 hypothetical protein GCM10011572_38480 [Pseudoduganella buxea]
MTTTDPAGFPLTGDAALDMAHRALFAEWRRIAALPTPAFAPAFHAAVAMLERDFREEEDLMEEMDFPGLACHREQHARALSGLHHAAAMLAEGKDKPARHAIVLLLDWLTIHIGTLDLALAVATDLARAARR